LHSTSRRPDRLTFNDSSCRVSSDYDSLSRSGPSGSILTLEQNLSQESLARRASISPRYHPKRAWAIAALIFVTLATNARSQEAPAADSVTASPQASSNSTTQSTIRGSVVDREAAVYQGVRITLAAVAASNSSSPPTTTTAVTDSNGRFSFPNLEPGSYQITVSSTGFVTQSVTVLVHAGENLETAPIVLPVSSTSTEVRVTASQEEVAEIELKEEEKQRVFGVLPNFYIAYSPNAAPLNSKQKFNLFWKSTIDPVTFIATGIFAGIEQAQGDFKGYGTGFEGYAKRYAANYADNFIGSAIGSAILPSLLKQDPRYFYKGTGSVKSRALYAIAMTVVAKGDNRRWQPNYSGILGGLAAGGISNLYYPAADRNGVGLTFENTAIGIASGAVQNLLQEFLIRKLTPRLPKYPSATPQTQNQPQP
jgi:hypothetical protein